MTVFDNIKTNNWPSTSNEFEDFLVLELPLNDAAALTSSRRDIVAGSKVLYPKRTLTNTSVSLEAHDPNAGTIIKIPSSEYSTSGSVTDVGNLFDGDTSTTVSSADGARIYWTPASNISVTKFEVYFSSQYGGYKIGVEVTGGSSQVITKSNPGNSPGWVEFTSIAGDTIGPSNQIMFRSYRSNDTDPGILGINAIRVNDKIVTTTGGAPKKHYDNHARWGASSVNYISTDALKGVSLNQPWTCEFYWLKDGTQHGNHGHFLLNPNNQTIGYREAPATGTSTNDFYCDIGGTTAFGMITTTITEGVWNHFAFVHEGGGTLKTYLNGQLETTKTIGTTGTFADATSIGGGVGSYTAQGVKGFIQDYRIYLTAKYTANFTPPSAILG